MVEHTAQLIQEVTLTITEQPAPAVQKHGPHPSIFGVTLKAAIMIEFRSYTWGGLRKRILWRSLFG